MYRACRLRRTGSNADIKWDKGLLLVRRSQTIGNDVMETTKTDLHQRLALPHEVLEVLRWHIEEQLLPKKMRESELLFPTVMGSLARGPCWTSRSTRSAG